MKTIELVLLILLIHLGTICLQAQGNEKPMSRLEKMIGKWEGTAVMTRGDTRTEIKQTEDITTELAGDLIIVKGKGRDAKSDSVVFEAFGVIHYDQLAGMYKLSAYTNNGNYTLASAKFEDNKFIWWFDVPQGSIRYTLSLSEKSWVEDGHFSSDQENWYPFIHMELSKIE